MFLQSYSIDLPPLIVTAASKMNEEFFDRSDLFNKGPVSDRLLDHRPSIIDDRIWCKPAPNSIVY